MNKRMTVVILSFFGNLYLSVSADAKVRGSMSKSVKVTNFKEKKERFSVVLPSGVYRGPLLNYLVISGSAVIVNDKIVSTGDEGDAISEYSSVEEFYNAKKGYCSKIRLVGKQEVSYWAPCN